jgi:hypothetical protein
MAARDDRLVLLTRLCFTPLALATAIFGPVLLFLPGSTADYWAWPVRPDLSAVWIGAAYSFGALALALMLIQGRWISAAVPVASTLPFAVVMLAATIIHNDRFLTDTAAYYIWLGIYIILPVALPLMFWLNSAHMPPRSPDDVQLPLRLRTALSGAGLASALLGLTLVLAPDAVRGSWPWELSPLMARVIGGWLLFLATGGLAPLLEARYAAYRYYLPAAALWFLILLIGSIANSGDFDSGAWSTPVYFVSVAGAIAVLSGAFLLMERRLSQAPAPGSAPGAGLPAGEPP